jgi:hypothetical protein
MEPQPKNVYLIRSVWRGLKKGHIVKVRRDLQPAKDVKGGGGIAGEPKSNTSGTGSTGNE